MSDLKKVLIFAGVFAAGVLFMYFLIWLKNVL